MAQQMSNKAENEWLVGAGSSEATVLGKVKITIYKAAALGSITGSNAGPGMAISGTMPGLTYSWNFPINTFYKGANQEMVINTLNSVMETLVGNAIQSCQSYPAAGAGMYDGDQVQITCNQPYGSDSGSFPTPPAQLQIRGEGIDLIGVNDPNFANLSMLPSGVYIAQPINGVTKRILGFIIED